MTYRDYALYLSKFFRSAKPVFAVADASDGSVGPILKNLGGKNLKLKILNGIPNGDFPAHGPDPMGEHAEEELSRTVKRMGADFGAVFDGDGDRILFVDDLGRSVNSDAAALLISRNFESPFIVTPVSGWTWRKALSLKDVRWSPVGHYFIKQRMKTAHAKFGAEPSGHYYFEFSFGSRKVHYDSALRALVEFASQVSILKKRGRKLSLWLDSLPKYFPLGELNFKVKDVDRVVASVKKVYVRRGKVSKLDGLSVEGKDFWFNLRLSNTEPLLRLNAEAKTRKELLALSSELKRLIRK